MFKVKATKCKQFCNIYLNDKKQQRYNVGKLTSLKSQSKMITNIIL